MQGVCSCGVKSRMTYPAGRSRVGFGVIRGERRCSWLLARLKRRRERLLVSNECGEERVARDAEGFVCVQKGECLSKLAKHKRTRHVCTSLAATSKETTRMALLPFVLFRKHGKATLVSIGLVAAHPCITRFRKPTNPICIFTRIMQSHWRARVPSGNFSAFEF